MLRIPGQQPPAMGSNSRPFPDETTRAFFRHSSAQRVCTDAEIAKAIKFEYPDLDLVIVPSWGVDLLAYALAGNANLRPLEQGDDDLPSALIWKVYVPPDRRTDCGPGKLVQDVHFARYMYTWQGTDFMLYVVDGRDGTTSLPSARNNYLLTLDLARADALVMAAGQWGNELHEEVWVWDRGAWARSAELYRSVLKASWDAVILDEDMKKAIIADHQTFFDSRGTYDQLNVPWKRGVIYHGPPGNGKTISIKAMMRTLCQRKDPIPALYVRSSFSHIAPECGISQIFLKARQSAPCYLIFEDLDSLTTGPVRRFFLNEMDGLESNDGIFVVGSTSRLDRLDPGISKRPSRFDRHYYFPNPDGERRVAYCRLWQRKLANNKDVEFPDKLCNAIAGVTDGFSFAYIQEAFVAALLAIARVDPKGVTDLEDVVDGDIEAGWVGVARPREDGDDELGHLILWVEIQKQVAILRGEMEATPDRLRYCSPPRSL